MLKALLRLATAICVALLAPAAALAAADDGLRHTFESFGGTVTITISRSDEPRARLAFAAAEEEIRKVADLVPPTEAGRHEIDRLLLHLLERAQQFCRWSQGAHGPLGGRLYGLWGIRLAPPRGRPSPAARAAAIDSARCERLTIDSAAGAIELAPGSTLDLEPFAAGFAADRAVEALAAAGVTNALVQTGAVIRGVGPGPRGRGWTIELPVFPGVEGPPQRYRLRDQALAIAAADAAPLVIAGDRMAPFIDQRTGSPASGIVATVAATELGIDAQALAVAAFLMGTREGSYRLGQLQPIPAVQWLLGGGTGQPLISSFHWSQLATD